MHATLVLEGGRGLTLEVRDDLDRVNPSQINAWRAELETLGHDETVKRFLELQEKIVWADDSDAGRVAQRPSRSWPFDLYNAFEFARDLAGRDASIFTLSRLLGGRFPELSGEGRQALIQFLLDNGRTEVIRKSASGSPTWYRFALVENRAAQREPTDLGVPNSELSRFKTKDLEDIWPAVAFRSPE